MGFKKLVAVLLCAAMIGSVFAGCGQTSSDTAVKEDSQMQSEVVETQPEEQQDFSFAFNDAQKAAESESVDADIKLDTDYINGTSTIKDKADVAEDEADDIIGTIIEADKNKDAVEDSKETNPDDKEDLPFDQAHPDIFQSEDVEYADNTILVKLNNSFDEKVFDELKSAGVGMLDYMFSLTDATWYTAYLYKDTDVNQVIEDVRAFDFVDVAEYNYKYETSSIEDVDLNEAVTANAQVNDQWVLKSSGIQSAWDELEAIGKTPGGSSAVTVAVIDTGVDYTHEDLKNNIWTNVDEIPDNGIDDDENGYIDDYYGVNITADNNKKNELSGMDDNGHGTHVAGIVAASNNNTGVVGIAYNTKVMPIKAGDASGFFNQDDIAKAIIYAYEEGADVINMSFGGAASSVAVQDALEVAYLRCVLVASAGNDSRINEGANALPNYPAAFSFVLGVMSVDMLDRESSFTNYDWKLYTNVEYEVYAPGYQILSTIPGDRYTKMSGTSMAAPVVAAQAALLRSYFADTDLYPTKFIYGQIVGTATTPVTCFDEKVHGIHNIPGAVDFYNSIVDLPTPDIGMSDYTVFDSEEFIADSEDITKGLLDKNNADGRVDAGEVLALGFTLKNRWGMAEDVTVTLDALSTSGVENPYVTILNNGLNYGSIGTYSENDCGKIYNNDLDAIASKDSLWTGWKNPFYIQIDKDCPNDYTVTLNLTITSKNALDPADDTVYETKESILLEVRRGVLLPSRIEEDTTLTKDNYYILANAMTVAEGATLTIEPGTQIQFWSNDPEDAYAEKKIAYIDVRGKLISEGTAEEPVEMFPSGLMHAYIVQISQVNDGFVELNYTNVQNPVLNIDEANNCEFSDNYPGRLCYRRLESGQVYEENTYSQLYIDKATECSMYRMAAPYMDGTFNRCIFVDCANYYFDEYENADTNIYKECVFYGNNLSWGAQYSPIDKSTMDISTRQMPLSADQVMYNAYTGTTYIVLGRGNRGQTFHYSNEDTVKETNSYIDMANFFAGKFGGYILHLDSQTEADWIANRLEYIDQYNDYTKTGYAIGMYLDEKDGTYRQFDGSLFPEDIEVIVYPELIPGHFREGKVTVGDKTKDQLYRFDKYIIEIPGEIYITEINLDEYVVNLDLETTHQIDASVAPDSGDVTKLLYESLDTEVATVDEKGLVTPVASGTTEVRVYAPDKGVYNYVTVNVTEAVDVEGIAFADEAVTVDVGTQKRLGVVFTPINTTKRTLRYEVEDETVAAVSEKGVVTALKEGTTTITVYGDNDLSATLTVNCVVPVASIHFEEKLYAAQTNQVMELPEDLYPVFTPADTTNKDLVWESANPEIAKVESDEAGVYTLITGEVEGNTILRATVEGADVYAEIQVAVSDSISNAKVVKVDYDGNENAFFALLDDGTLWTWGVFNPYPHKLSMENVLDVDASNGYLSVATGDGKLSLYHMNDNEFTLSRSKTLDAKKVVARSGDRHYTLDSSGRVWYLQNLSIDIMCEAVEVPIAATIVDLKGFNGFFVAVSDDNTVYLLNGSTAAEFMTDVDEILCGNTIGYFYKDNQVYVYNSSGYCTNTYTLNAGECFNDFVYYCTRDGKLYLYGQNTDGRLGIGSDEYNIYSYAPMVNVSSVKDVFVFDKNIFVQTEDGKFYGTGYGGYYGLGDGNTASTNVPKRIILGLKENEFGLTVEDTNFVTYEDAEEIIELQEDSIIVDYSGYLKQGTTYAGIGVKDSSGSYLSVSKELRMDKLVVTPNVGWVQGESYTLTIPASSLLTGTDAYNTEYAVTFIYTGTESEDTEITPDDSVTDDFEDVTHTTVRDEEVLADRYYITQAEVERWIDEYIDKGYNHRFYSNVILNRTNDDDVSGWMRVVAPNSSDYVSIGMAGNYWGTTNEDLINKQIFDYDVYQSLADINVGEYLTEAPDTTYPFVVDAYLTVEDEVVDTVGKGEVTFVVNFNRAMDTSIDLEVAFGSAYPHRDYEVNGAYVSPTQWQGTITLSTLIENGYQYWSVSNGKAEGTSLKLFGDWGRFPFKIDTSAAQALIMQAVVEADGIYLSWTQDEYETLAGYNVYRSTKEDGLYEKINKTVIPADTKEFFDDGIEPGETYYYNFTVVDTDLTESEPSGKISVTALDTMAPNIYHSPIYTAFTGNNLVVSATVTDNVGIKNATLYYRTTGTSDWNSKSMTNNNDKFSAVISSEDITVAGLEYYIAAFDGITYTYKGSADEPYQVMVQLAVSDNDLGDVDGNGAIELKDAMMVLMAINDKWNLDPEQFARGDINGNGILEALEALRIMQYVNGAISSVPF